MAENPGFTFTIVHPHTDSVRFSVGSPSSITTYLQYLKLVSVGGSVGRCCSLPDEPISNHATRPYYLVGYNVYTTDN